MACYGPLFYLPIIFHLLRMQVCAVNFQLPTVSRLENSVSSGLSTFWDGIIRERYFVSGQTRASRSSVPQPTWLTIVEVIGTQSNPNRPVLDSKWSRSDTSRSPATFRSSRAEVATATEVRQIRYNIWTPKMTVLQLLCFEPGLNDGLFSINNHNEHRWWSEYDCWISPRASIHSSLTSTNHFKRYYSVIFFFTAVEVTFQSRLLSISVPSLI